MYRGKLADPGHPPVVERNSNTMQVIRLTLVILLTAWPGVSLAQDAASEAQIRAVIADQVVAWNTGDGNAYARQLAPDASFTNLFGMVMYGAPAFAKRHSEILSTFYRGTTKSHVVRRLRFVTSDVAVVDIDNEVRGVKTVPGGIVVPPDGVVKTQLMEVFVRREGRWWVEAYHNVDLKSAK
jgi:uncharacterized protein (TIGR02246 family)